jgi:ribose 5-phosphate isomerase A
VGTSDGDTLKQQAALAAVDQIRDGMIVGLGTGSTAALAVTALGERVRQGLRILAIPTSDRTAAQARLVGIELTDFSAHPRLDLTIDGADEVLPGRLDLIKGLGGALLREKIVAAASERLIIMADYSKLVTKIGEKSPVPVEITQFGWSATCARIATLGADVTLRKGSDGCAYVTDNGNYIVDCRFAPITDAGRLEADLARIVGVVESGLFVGLATQAMVATPSGLQILDRE